MYEVEIRAEVNQEDIKKNIDKLNAENDKEIYQEDDYFKCSFDKERNLIFRVRTKGNKKLLTLKGSSKEETDSAWQEWETEITDDEILKNIFLTNSYERVVQIKKHRETYKTNNLEINIDKVERLGTFIEIEKKSNSPKEAKEELVKILEDLGVKKEDIIEEGYVPLMLKKMNDQ